MKNSENQIEGRWGQAYNEDMVLKGQIWAGGEGQCLGREVTVKDALQEEEEGPGQQLESNQGSAKVP
jgi:hypothetical protein